MTQDNQQEPIEEAGGYGTPTAEQEMPDRDTKSFATPDPSRSGAEDQDSGGEPGAGRSGGTEEQMSSENASAGPGYEGDAPQDREAAVPSSEAEMDEANTEEPDAGRPFSSEPGQEAGGLPDGSGTDLPESQSPKDKDDDSETFDAG
jgi:hypothetical protein